MGVLAAVHAGAAEGIVWVVFVEPIILVKHRNSGSFDRGHVAEGVPHYLEMVVHLAAASHEKALGNILSSVAAAAGKLQLFKKMNTLALHLSVADKIESGCQTGKTGADDVCGFFIHILRLFGMGKRFISSCGIIHIEASCFLSARIFLL